MAGRKAQYDTPIKAKGVGLPEDWWDAIEARATESGKTVPEYIREVLGPVIDKVPYHGKGGNFGPKIKKTRQTDSRLEEIFWFYTDLRMTLAEIGEVYGGLSRQRIHQLLKTMGLSGKQRRHEVKSNTFEYFSDPHFDYKTNEELAEITGLRVEVISMWRSKDKSRWKRRTNERYFLRSFLVDEKDKCWEWQGSKSAGGYGQWRPKTDLSIYAHHFSYKYFNGIGNLEDKWVLHSCGNPGCVNPHHLYLGDSQDNVNDRTDHGNSNGSKFDFETAEQIRAEYDSGEYTYKDLATRYDCTVTTIYNICNHRTYADKFTRRRHHGRQLTEEQAQEIRDKYATGNYTYKQLADEYGFKSTNSVYQIVAGTTYGP